MTDERDENDVERLFADLRAAEAPEAPPFEGMFAAALADANMRAARAGWRRALTAAAALVLVVVGGGWLVLRSRQPRTPSPLATLPAPPVALSEWRSPTAFLLHGPGDVLVTTVPTISAASAELNAIGVRAGRRRHS